jgi:hypothetical protein
LGSPTERNSGSCTAASDRQNCTCRRNDSTNVA